MGGSEQAVALPTNSIVAERDDGRFRERPMITPNQRRQLEKLAPYVEPVVATDIAFFKKHPDRRHRATAVFEHAAPSRAVEIASLAGDSCDGGAA